MSLPWTEIGATVAAVAAIVTPVGAGVWKAWGTLRAYLDDRAEKDDQTRKLLLDIAREQASQRRDFAEEQRAAFQRQVDAIHACLIVERDQERVARLSGLLRESQDAWLDYLRRAAIFLDEGDPSLLNDPAYARDLRAKLRKAAPIARDASSQLSASRVSDLQDLLARVNGAVTVTTTKQDILSEANALLAVNDYASAVAKYSQVLQEDPDNLEALFGRAFSLDSLGRFEDSLKDYNRESELAPDATAFLLNRAVVHFELGHYDEAKKDVDRWLMDWPEDTAALHWRAFILAAANRLDEARADYEQALELRPDFPPTLADYATLLWKLGETEKATAIIARIESPQPTDTNTLLNLAGFYAVTKDLDKAWKYIGLGIEIEPRRRKELNTNPDLANLRAAPDFATRMQAIAAASDTAPNPALVS